MATIGRVYKESYTKNGNVYPLIQLDIRTISLRKKFSISVNKNKYPDGKITDVPMQGKEEHPDYHIWANFSNRGESIPSVIVGSIKNAVSEGGLAYKRGKIFDPFLSRESIYISLFTVDDDKKTDENHLYDVVAQPYVKQYSNNGANDAPAHANYNTPQEQSEPQATYQKSDGGSIPIENEEIPF